MLKTKLIQALTPALITDAARLKTLCAIIEAIIRHKTVNLTILATSNDGQDCSNESRYRRFQDFFYGGFLTLSDVSIPLAWKILPIKTRQGNSNPKQRISLMKKLLKVLAVESIHALTMGHETEAQRR